MNLLSNDIKNSSHKINIILLSIAIHDILDLFQGVRPLQLIKLDWYGLRLHPELFHAEVLAILALHLVYGIYTYHHT